MPMKVPTKIQVQFCVCVYIWFAGVRQLHLTGHPFSKSQCRSGVPLIDSRIRTGRQPIEAHFGFLIERLGWRRSGVVAHAGLSFMFIINSHRRVNEFRVSAGTPTAAALTLQHAYGVSTCSVHVKHA